MYSVISVNMSVDSDMRVLNPQKSPVFLLVRVAVPLGCNVPKQIHPFADHVLRPVSDQPNVRSIAHRGASNPQVWGSSS